MRPSTHAGGMITKFVHVKGFFPVTTYTASRNLGAALFRAAAKVGKLPVAWFLSAELLSSEIEILGTLVGYVAESSNNETMPQIRKGTNANDAVRRKDVLIGIESNENEADNMVLILALANTIGCIAEA